MKARRLEYAADPRGARNAATIHALFAAGCLATGVAVWLLPPSISGASMGARVGVNALTLAGATLFGWIAVQFVQRLRSDDPLVVLGPEGLADHGSAVFSGVGTVPWSEVEEIRLGRYQGLPCVEVVLRDREKLLKRLSWHERLGRSERLGYPALAFRGPLLPEEPERMVEEMRSYLRSIRDAPSDEAARGAG